ncbi:MAG TPA: hypothetical protein VNV25_25545 [Gemmatimonadaceae bacterium]|jgi:hypothetical protein|nr:hypothetical protein [Gemmatimonadaceae bacterium]
MRCSCGQHDLPEGRQTPCHFCGHPTLSEPVVMWDMGLFWYPICHACTQTVPFEQQRVTVHLAPPELVARAHAHGPPCVERRA